MARVLVTDGNQRSALAATRSLGARRIEVVVADEFDKAIAGVSKYCREYFHYPSPYRFPERFISTLSEFARERRIDVLFPMTDVTTHLVLRHRSCFSNVQIPYSSYETFELLTNKQALCELARALGVRTPATFVVDRLADIANADIPLNFPLVIKSYRSRVFTDGMWINAPVRYAMSETELRRMAQQTSALAEHPVLIQECINGVGYGIFALYDHGQPLTFFGHRRIREKPPSGGVSVLSESVEPQPGMLAAARRILDYVKFHGVAMVEFKLSNTGEPYLIEVNARFWGSLQLAIDAGVDFPYLLYQLATGETPETGSHYKVGLRSRWLLGDLDNLYLRLRKQPYRFPNARSALVAILSFLKFSGRGLHYDVIRLDDMKPFLCELGQYLHGK